MLDRDHVAAVAGGDIVSENQELRRIIGDQARALSVVAGTAPAPLGAPDIARSRREEALRLAAAGDTRAAEAILKEVAQQQTEATPNGQGQAVPGSFRFG